MRDMVVAIGVLVLIVLAVAGLGRACSFAPAGPTVEVSGLPVVDAPALLRALAPTVPFALRAPAVPADWRSNAVGQDRVGNTGRRAVRAGYLPPQGTYLRLLQTDATEDALLAATTGTHPLAAQGTREVAGRRWVIYGTRPDEPIWITDVDGVRLLISGSGTDADYTTLATATLSAPTLTPGG